MFRNTETSWGTIAKLMHWGIAILIVAQIVLGLVAIGWRLSPTKLNLFIWHKSLGILLLTLIAARLLWRFANPTPRLPAGTPGWERIAAHASHALLYICMLALPVSGWIINSAANVPLRVFWLFPLPAITAPDKALAETMKLVHLGLVIALTAVLVLHIGAALRHHFVKRTDVLVRMLPGRNENP
jgi:cytochrome b561